MRHRHTPESQCPRPCRVATTPLGAGGSEPGGRFGTAALTSSDWLVFLLFPVPSESFSFLSCTQGAGTPRRSRHCSRPPGLQPAPRALQPAALTLGDRFREMVWPSLLRKEMGDLVLAIRTARSSAFRSEAAVGGRAALEGPPTGARGTQPETPRTRVLPRPPRPLRPPALPRGWGRPGASVPARRPGRAFTTGNFRAEGEGGHGAQGHGLRWQTPRTERGAVGGAPQMPVLTMAPQVPAGRTAALSRDTTHVREGPWWGDAVEPQAAHSHAASATAVTSKATVETSDTRVTFSASA